jgi:hypothetical protein
MVYQWFGLKIIKTVFSDLALKSVATVSPDLASKPVAWVFCLGLKTSNADFMIWASKSPR